MKCKGVGSLIQTLRGFCQAFRGILGKQRNNIGIRRKHFFWLESSAISKKTVNPAQETPISLESGAIFENTLNPAQEVFPQHPDPRNNPNRCTFDLESSATSLPIPPATIRIVLCCGSPLSSHHNVNRCGIRTSLRQPLSAREGGSVCARGLSTWLPPRQPAGARPLLSRSPLGRRLPPTHVQHSSCRTCGQPVPASAAPCGSARTRDVLPTCAFRERGTALPPACIV